ncbi:MAG: membrane protein insertion efficiency factor YidD [Candidatus Melainabacteria bacterium]|nr:membrane protein insertion efficiency factor YidD [Candidatus Melainabacteria bacterium]
MALPFSTNLWQKTRFLRSLFGFFECRFYPSCSDYFLESIQKHGLFIGLALSVKRILRCHPLCEGGIDEVPRFRGYKVSRLQGYEVARLIHGF